MSFSHFSMFFFVVRCFIEKSPDDRGYEVLELHDSDLGGRKIIVREVGKKRETHEVCCLLL